MLAGCVGLTAPDIVLLKKRLTLKVAQLDNVIVMMSICPTPARARYDEAAVPSAP